MKTPREILFARHQAVAPKLDALRREVLTKLNHQDTKAPSGAANLVPWCLGGAKQLWLELVWPCRRIWAGLAAVWIGILIANFSQRDQSPAMVMKSAPSPEMILSFRQQERLLSELIGPNEPSVAEPPKIVLPQPRSQRRIEVLMT
jgi:hypothetical protein